MDNKSNSGNEFIIAKVAVTLKRIMNIDSMSTILDICQKHNKYKISLHEQLMSFDGENIDETSIKEMKEILEEHSLLYSYCFDYYTLLPAIIAFLNYEVIILVSEGLYEEKKEYFSNIDNTISKILGRRIKVNFLTNKTPNLLFKLKAAIKANTKVIMYVDGNKGSSNDKLENVHITRFKGNDIFFHQGFSFLSYMLKSESIVGVVPTMIENEIVLKLFIDQQNVALQKKEYIASVTETLVRNIDNIITVDNIHKWNNLLSVYQ